MALSLRLRRASPRNPRLFWLGQLRRWHWISGALSMGGLLLFAVTGFTLNHAAQIEARPVVTTREAVLPPALLDGLAEGAPLPAGLAAAHRCNACHMPLPPLTVELTSPQSVDGRPAPYVRR